METLYLQFLHILKHALLGQPLTESPRLTPSQWEQAAQIAQQHKVTPMFYEAIRLLPELSGTEFLQNLRNQSRRQVIVQTQKSYDFLKLYSALREAGVTPLVVKGILCRALYPLPDHRPSSDEDLLILPDDFTICHDVLVKHDLLTGVSSAQMETDYEIPYHSSTGPLFIELHKNLFPPESEAYGDMNRFFEGVFCRASAVNIQGTTVYTLAPTDHLFYLICHAFKHFLHSGFGIRQVCDIILYTNAYGTQIDWAKLMDQCRQIRAEYFTAALYRIGETFLVFDPQKAGYPLPWQQLQVDEVPLLQDILDGGVYGSASINRQHSSNITLNAMASSKKNRGAGNAAVISAFPPAHKLEGRYPWLKKHPWLLPAAWAHRLLRYRKETRHSTDSSASEALKIGSKRIALLKQYGIVR